MVAGGGPFGIRIQIQSNISSNFGSENLPLWGRSHLPPMVASIRLFVFGQQAIWPFDRLKEEVGKGQYGLEKIDGGNKIGIYEIFKFEKNYIN
jgi:hypothetical protein